MVSVNRQKLKLSNVEMPYCMKRIQICVYFSDLETAPCVFYSLFSSRNQVNGGVIERSFRYCKDKVEVAP